ncbi:MAG: PA14 domain-containing protein [Vicinamibacterales bacterium]
MIPRPVLAGVGVVAGVFVLAASLSWSARQLERELSEQAGWTETFFASPDFRDPPRLTRQTPVIDLSVIDEEPSLPRGSFSVRWEGYWNLTHDGPVDIYAGGDDELYLHVDEKRVLERTPAAGMGTIAERLTLPPGIHHIRVDYVQHAGEAYANVLWAPAGEEARAFSPREVFPTEPDRQVLFTATLIATRERVASVVWRIGLVMLAGLAILPFALRRRNRAG